MKINRQILSVCYCTLMSGLAMAAGDLTPPATIEPTMKTLEEIEPRTIISELPYTISQPGAYYLTTNLSSSTLNANGITINSDHVTLDLNGFELAGYDDGTAGDGIYIMGLQTNIVIRNGTIRNWRDEGINGVNTSGSIFENLRLLDNDADGLLVNDYNLVLNCIGSRNGNDGLDTDDGCVIKNCTAALNGDNGIEGDDGCTIIDSAGIQNTGEGVVVGDGGTIRGCAGRDNGRSGIKASNGSSVLFSTGELNSEHGIFVIQGCLVEGCSARNNQQHGFRTFSTDNVIKNCRADNNALSGFYTFSSGGRLEGNHSTDNGYGFRATASGSFLIKNSASGNATNYNLHAGCSYGPIVNISAAGDISATPSADHPWANFSF